MIVMLMICLSDVVVIDQCVKICLLLQMGRPVPQARVPQAPDQITINTEELSSIISGVVSGSLFGYFVIYIDDGYTYSQIGVLGFHSVAISSLQ